MSVSWTSNRAVVSRRSPGFAAPTKQLGSVFDSGRPKKVYKEIRFLSCLFSILSCPTSRPYGDVGRAVYDELDSQNLTGAHLSGLLRVEESVVVGFALGEPHAAKHSLDSRDPGHLSFLELDDDRWQRIHQGWESADRIVEASSAELGCLIKCNVRDR